MSWLERPLYGGSAFDWTLALGIAFALTLVFYYVRRVVLKRVRAYAARTPTSYDDLIGDLIAATGKLFLTILALYLGAQSLDLAPKPTRVVHSVMIVALWVQAALWGSSAIAWWMGRALPAKRETDAAGATTLGVLGFIARVVVWSLVLLMILDNLGFDITALVASLGIGGIAVALAVQNILGDIFASLSIALDKPFVLGDFIIVGDMLGTVEYIGLKTTRVRSLTGEQIIFSNADLLQSRIRNYKRMFERRILFSFGVLYETGADQLERIPQLVREIVERHEHARFDRAHFKAFGDFSLNFEVVYYVKSPDYNVYMNIQQAINLELLRRLQADGIGFAYPTQTLYLQRAPAAAPKAAS
jgi:small-conductance mechanosensitive channel